MPVEKRRTKQVVLQHEPRQSAAAETNRRQMTSSGFNGPTEATRNAAANVTTRHQITSQSTLLATITATTTMPPPTTTTTTKTKFLFKPGKIAATTRSPNVAATNQLAQHPAHLLPQASLLKIEPFLPSSRRRAPPPPPPPPPPLIRRSHCATFSSRPPPKPISRSLHLHSAQNVLVQKKRAFTHSVAVDDLCLLPPRTAAAGCVAQARRKSSRTLLIPRERSKSSISCTVNTTKASKSANSKNAATSTLPPSSSAATMTQQPNGVCRITRTAQEQEKFPDRINHDRRGLTAIPIYEREPHLRLLSLQHNLINVLHIPGEKFELAAAETQQGRTASCSASPTKRWRRIGLLREQSEGSIKARATKSVNRREKVVAQIPLAFGDSAPKTRPSAKSSSRCLLDSAQHQPELRPTLLTKSSKSSIALYSQSLYNQNQAKASQLSRKIDAKMLALLNASTYKSFDSGTGSSILTTATTDSTSTNVDDAQALQRQQLSVSNKQLSITYGATFRHLVFLDLYDNQIERISNLDGLPVLSVLLLGKNRISSLSGLSSLRSSLRVLDLHGNKITQLSHQIGCLKELRSLNLAGNQIRQITTDDFKGLLNLKELNLKRNRLKRLKGFQHLTGLERLWLCHNELHTVEDMSTIAKAVHLLEVTIEHNPVTVAGDCVSFLVSYLPRLQLLGQKAVTEQVRQAAMAWRLNKERSLACIQHPALSRELFNSLRREEVIANARTNWELLRSEQSVSQHLSQRHIPLKSNELARIIECGDFEFTKSNQPTLDSADSEAEVNKEDSSLGPNIDSSSSCYGSGVEDDDDDDDDGVNFDLSLANECNKASSYLNEKSKETSCSREEIFEVNDDGLDAASCSFTTKLSDEENRSTMTREDNHHSKTNPDSAKTCLTARQQPKESDSDGDGGGSNLLLPQGISSACVLVLPQAGVCTPAAAAIAAGRQPRTVPAVITSVPRGTATAAAFIPASSAALNPTFSNQANDKNTTSNNNTSRKGGKINTGSMNLTGGQTQTPTQTSNAFSNASRRIYMRSNRVRSHAAVGSRRVVALSDISGNQNQQLAHTLHAVALTATNDGMDRTASSSSSSLQTSACGLAETETAPETQTQTQAATTAASKTAVTHQSSLNAATTATTTSTTVTTAESIRPLTEREREQGSDYLIEICGHDLNVYGQGALRHIDKQWSPAKANDVHSLNFSYIHFNNIASILGRIKARFPFAERYVFRETNISCLGQLNALAELQGITSLCIHTEGNAITTKDLWRLYAIYRLSHWGLRWLNGCEVDEAAVEEANTVYAGLSDLVLWAMPEVMLQPLLARLCLDETGSGTWTAKEWLMKAEKSLRIVVGKEALQWRKTTGTIIDLAGGGVGVGQPQTTAGGSSSALTSLRDLRERGRSHLAEMMQNTYNAIEKLNKLETLWPTLLMDIVRDTLLDYARLDAYLDNLMVEMMSEHASSYPQASSMRSN